MFKILFMLIFITVPYPALSALKYGVRMECFLDTEGNNSYWYCGGGQTSCAKNKMNKNDNRTYYSNGEAHTFNNKTYVCCNATDTSEGVFKEIKNDSGNGITWQNTSNGSTAYYTKTVVKDLPGGGKCTYTAKFNGCGKELTKPCTEPTNCTDGYIMRNKVCVKPCPMGTDFESTTSNKCVECPTTVYQGSVNAAETSYCLKCDKDKQFLDKENDKCIDKKDMNKVSRQTMAKCFMCDNNEDFKQCVACVDGNTCSDDIKKSCNLNE